MNMLVRRAVLLAVCTFAAFLQAAALRADEKPSAPAAPQAKEHDGQHDFDFEIGTWKTHLRRRLHPLTGSTTSLEMDRTTICRKVWEGRDNLLELVADGAGAHFEGLSLRLYNEQTHQWSLNFSHSGDGSMALPTIGGFKDGRGEFYDQETLN